jgi:hypothetical protein
VGPYPCTVVGSELLDYISYLENLPRNAPFNRFAAMMVRSSHELKGRHLCAGKMAETSYQTGTAHEAIVATFKLPTRMNSS